MNDRSKKAGRESKTRGKRSPEAESLYINDAYQNLSLDQVYKKFTRQAQESELVEMAHACFEADYLWLSELPKAFERQELESDCDLDFLYRNLRSRRPSVREGAEEIIEELAEYLVEWDLDFAELYNRSQYLHEARISLEEFHIKERKIVGIERKFPAYQIRHLLRNFRSTLPIVNFLDRRP